MGLLSDKGISLLAILLVFVASSALRSRAQSSGETGTSAGASSSATAAKLEAERRRIWNSPDMVEARAYLETYFERSAKITDAQAKKYMDDLRAKDPDQMRVWLQRFKDERGEIRRQNQVTDRAREMALTARQPAPNVGGFQNPYAGRGAVSAGMPVGQAHAYFDTQNTLAQRPAIQKPFSSPAYRRANLPLVTSEEFARREILGGILW